MTPHPNLTSDLPIEDGPSDGLWLVRENGLFLRVVSGEHRTTVADGIVSEANARLIAAAPDMLAALQMMVAHSDKLIADGSYDYRKPRVQELYDMCAAAIARAEGRS